MTRWGGKAEERDTRVTTDLDRRLGQRVRSRRLAIGMTQERLAALLGVSFQQVQKYEKGVNRISAQRLVTLSHALECTLDTLLEGFNGETDSEATEQTPLEMLSDVHAVELLKLFARVKSQRMRASIVDLVRALIEDEGR